LQYCSSPRPDLSISRVTASGTNCLTSIKNFKKQPHEIITKIKYSRFGGAIPKMEFFSVAGKLEKNHIHGISVDVFFPAFSSWIVLFSRKYCVKTWISGSICRGKIKKSRDLKTGIRESNSSHQTEAPVSQLSFFDLNPPPHSSTQAGDEEKSDSELSLESSMESLTLLGQEDTPLKNSVQSQVNDLNHKVEYHSVSPLVVTGALSIHLSLKRVCPPPRPNQRWRGQCVMEWGVPILTTGEKAW
jgi:hypothetical protein